jgi:hypothetical protein
MAETKVYISDPFNRDVTWITDQMVEEFAGACLRGRRAADDVALYLCQGNYAKADLLRTYLVGNYHFEQLKQELIDTFGLETFIKPKTREEHIRELEDRMENEKDNEVYTKLAKELREFRGWVVKPSDGPPVTVNVNNVANAMTSINKSNPRELQRAYASIIG